MKNFALACVLAATSALLSSSMAGVEVGDKMPALSPKSMEGGSIRNVEELKGKVVLYEFFAFW